MSLAMALLRTPIDPRGLPALELLRCPKEASSRPTGGHWPTRPQGMIEAAAISYIIGRIATKSISQVELAAWVDVTYGIEYSPSTLMLAIKRYKVPRKQRERTMPESILAECAQLAIIQVAHGVKQPWGVVTDRLWLRHKLLLERKRVMERTRLWMRAWMRAQKG